MIPKKYYREGYTVKPVCGCACQLTECSLQLALEKLNFDPIKEYVLFHAKEEYVSVRRFLVGIAAVSPSIDADLHDSGWYLVCKDTKTIIYSESIK